MQFCFHFICLFIVDGVKVQEVSPNRIIQNMTWCFWLRLCLWALPGPATVDAAAASTDGPFLLPSRTEDPLNTYSTTHATVSNEEICSLTRVLPRPSRCEFLGLHALRLACSSIQFLIG